MSALFTLTKELFSNKKLIWILAKNDFKTRFSGSFFGIVWAFIQPLMTILIFWFVFSVGLRVAAQAEIPFICWLTAGLVPWFFFADAWACTGNCFYEYSYLVKKMVFRISMLPLVKIISSAFIHLFFIFILICLYIVYGFYPKLIYIQLVYYFFCMFFLCIALSFITASIAPFFKDIGNIVGICLQFGMWMTPIIWSYEIIPPKYSILFKLNPMYYIVQGYRDTLIPYTNIWFWFNIKQTIYFWFITLTLFIIGSLLYRRLRPHFADVL